MTIALPPAPRGAPVSPMVGAHPSMLHLREEIRHAARLAGPVLIEGPTGAGKELVAELLHVESGRAGPLVALNVTTLPEQLADAELFGTERGAYTGASERPGLLEEARGGTLYLDEAGDLSPALQAKLLRAIESGRIRRLGTARERASDVGVLANHFLAMLGEPSLAGDCVEYLMAYPWPGNVRELRRVVERAAFLGRGRGIGTDELREALRQTTGVVPLRRTSGPSRLLRDIERAHIEAVLEEEGYNVAAAAGALGLSLRALYYRFRVLGIVAPRSRRLRRRTDGVRQFTDL